MTTDFIRESLPGYDQDEALERLAELNALRRRALAGDDAAIDALIELGDADEREDDEWTSK